MASNPEHIMSTPETQDEPVTWIGRERPGRPGEASLAPPPDTAGAGQGTGSRKWIIGAVVAVAALIAASVLWRATHPKAALLTLADQQNIPLISVMTPGVRAVTSNVTFTGAISARYDMPIGIEATPAASWACTSRRAITSSGASCSQRSTNRCSSRR